MDISGRYSAFPSSAWVDGKPADCAFLLANLGSLLTDDETPRVNVRGRLLAVQIVQSRESITVVMYDDSGLEVLNMTQPFYRDVHEGHDVVSIRTLGTVGKGVDDGRISHFVEIIRMRREQGYLHVQSESVQTYPRWLWIPEKRFYHDSSFIFPPNKSEPNQLPEPTAASSRGSS